MKPGTAYTLERPNTTGGADALGTLTVTDTEMFAVHATFAALPAFDPYRALFDEDAGHAHLLARDDDPALLAQAEAVMESILALGLVLRRGGDLGFRTFLLSIEGQHAGFRPLTPEEESL